MMELLQVTLVNSLIGSAGASTFLFVFYYFKGVG
jgi:hypothetical protein